MLILAHAAPTSLCLLIFIGYYADPEAECQVFHICTSSADPAAPLEKYSFLCPNGTIFNQNYFICDWWFNVDCSEAEALAAARNGELEAARSEADARLVEARDAEADTVEGHPVGGCATCTPR